MLKKLTITVDAESLVAGYTAMAADEARETEAKEWTEALIGDVADDPARSGG